MKILPMLLNLIAPGLGSLLLRKRLVAASQFSIFITGVGMIVKPSTIQDADAVGLWLMAVAWIWSNRTVFREQQRDAFQRRKFPTHFRQGFRASQ